jgi:hypothetical protein
MTPFGQRPDVRLPGRPRINADPQLVRALDTAHECAEDLVRALDALALRRALALALDCDLDRDIDGVRALSIDALHYLGCAHALALDRALRRALDRALHQALGLDRVIVLDLHRNRARDLALALGPDPDRALSLAGQAVTAIATARDLAKAGASRDVGSLLERSGVRITATAVQVAAAAARLLPAGPGPLRRGIPQ